jgi:hypothetical protein
MHLIQILLPLYDNEGQAQPRELFQRVRAELTDRFGGLTAYTRAPAAGHWHEAPNKTAHDEIVIYEIMTDELDVTWWQWYRKRLEAKFRQDQVVVRAQEVRLL